MPTVPVEGLEARDAASAELLKLGGSAVKESGFDAGEVAKIAAGAGLMAAAFGLCIVASEIIADAINRKRARAWKLEQERDRKVHGMAFIAYQIEHEVRQQELLEQKARERELAQESDAEAQPIPRAED